MDKLFLTILNMSLTGAFVIAAICVARLSLKKAPKIISYCLWSVAGFRLVFPFSIESVFSLIPFKAQTIPPDIATQSIPRIDSGIPFVNNAVRSVLPAATPQYSANPLQIWIDIGALVWIVGVAVMLVYGVVSFFILKRKMKEAAHIEENIYEAENIKSPFVLGIFRPRIYLPTGLSAQERSYIILHEKTHIRRRDHIVKFAAYFVVCLHWFNPLAWLAFVLMGADMEMSCDERVMKVMGGETKKDYSLSLLSLATEQRIIGGSPLAFGEGSMKERIKNVLNFRKPSRVIIVAAVALAAVLSIGFAVNRAINEPLIEMKMVYEDNPAFFFKDMKLIWDDTVYHVTPISRTERGKEIGYATDEYSTWRIYELKGYGRDYLLAVESEEVWRVMSSHPPETPWRQYILENATERQRVERLLSVTLYNDGTARLATPLISSYALLAPYYYSLVDGELLIHYEHDNVIARFAVIDDNTLVFKEASVPLFADEGARYVSAPLADTNEMISPDMLSQIYLGMPRSKVEEVLGKRDGEGSGLDFWFYENLGSIYFSGNFYEDSAMYEYDEAIVTRVNLKDRIWDINELVSTAVKQHNANAFLGEFATESHVNLTIDVSAGAFTIYVISLYETFMPDGEYNVNLVGGAHMPLALTFTKNATGDYELTKYWQPKDGSEYISSIRSKFPEETWDRIDTQLYIERQKQNCYDDAMYFFVGATPRDGRYGIGAGTAALTNVAEDIAENGFFMIKYFPGATLQIEEYDEEHATYKPGNWIIEYADSIKNITIGKDGIGEIPITDDLIGIYHVDENQYVMKFEKYVRTD